MTDRCQHSTTRCSIADTPYLRTPPSPPSLARTQAALHLSCVYIATLSLTRYYRRRPLIYWPRAAAAAAAAPPREDLDGVRPVHERAVREARREAPVGEREYLLAKHLMHRVHAGFDQDSFFREKQCDFGEV